MKKTQNERVLDYMNEHGGITPLEAFNELGIMRLSARIYDLRRMGHRIDSCDLTVVNRYGEKVRVTLYLKKGEDA